MPPGDSAIQHRVIARVSRRVLPFFFLLYVIAYLDRANVSFAKMSMSADLGFSEAVYGLGAGVFFVGYFLLEIPGALIVERWSARLWLSRILITWGLCTIWVGFVRTPFQFYAARFCLGLAEAGFFPGGLVYLARWFPQKQRARAMSKFILAVPISFVIGAPVSAFCLSLHWFHLPGWTWLFVLQGLPAILCGIFTPFWLTDHPRDANWLDPTERGWLQDTLLSEKQWKETHSAVTVAAAFRDWRSWNLATALLFVVFGSYGFILWLPATIHKASGFSVIVSTLLSALPFAAAAICLLWIGYSSDRTGKRKLFAAVPLFAAGAFLAGVTIPGQPFALTMLWLVLTGSMLWTWTPSFWVLPTLALGESAAAASLGLINSIGNLGGFFGPMLVGYFLSKQQSSSFVDTLLCLAFGVAGGLVLLTPVPAETGVQHAANNGEMTPLVSRDITGA